MTIFKFPESIKSRPTYGKLEYREGKSYLFIADADGAEAIIDLANDNKSLMAKSHIIYIPNQTGDKYVSKLDKLDIYQLYIGQYTVDKYLIYLIWIHIYHQFD